MPQGQLDCPLQYVKGIGPGLAKPLAKLGLNKLGDVLWHVPRRWEDRRTFVSIRNIRSTEPVTLRGKIRAVSTTRPKGRISITKAILEDGGSSITLVFFNQPFVEKALVSAANLNEDVIVYGSVKADNLFAPEMNSPEWEIASQDSLSMNRIVPIYPLTEGVRQRTLRRLVMQALEASESDFPQVIPEDICRQYNLMKASEAFKALHFPEEWIHRDAGRRTLAFEEFLVIQTLAYFRRQRHTTGKPGIRMPVNLHKLIAELHEIVPFELTSAQRRAIGDIAADISSGHAMNRLVQGDVGSGKTIVAVAAILMAVQNGCQAALMAPTEVLAQQHAFALQQLLEPLGIPIALATGSMTNKARQAARVHLETGQARVGVGTHALIQDNTQFAKLGMVIIDEQHRFGVLQRQALGLKGDSPHILVMTATPIPRTVTLTMYGDLDSTIIDELPPGRRPVVTHWRTHEMRDRVYSGIREMLDQGRQAYVVCSLVEESEALQAKSAIETYTHMQNVVFPEYRVGLMHGQLKPDEKKSVMAQFKAHELDILVSTTVIEVGVDVPNASVMLIEDADRFGLAQLHQLRGRVGRGQHASYCILIASPKSVEGRARMEIMTHTTDGFKIADEDLRLRGPGEFFGTRQSGAMELKVGDLAADIQVIEECKAAAAAIAEHDPDLILPQHQPLKRLIQSGPQNIELAKVG